MATDPALKEAVDIVGNHTMAENPTPPDVKKMLDDMGKPIWNTEEHVYKEDNFDCKSAWCRPSTRTSSRAA